MHVHACTHSKDSHSRMMHFYSTELNQLVEKLDAFALEAAKSKKNFVPDRIERVISAEPSGVPPPPDAPNWALKPEWKISMLYNCIIVVMILTNHLLPLQTTRRTNQTFPIIELSKIIMQLL